MGAYIWRDSWGTAYLPQQISVPFAFLSFQESHIMNQEQSSRGIDRPLLVLDSTDRTMSLRPPQSANDAATVSGDDQAAGSRPKIGISEAVLSLGDNYWGRRPGRL